MGEGGGREIDRIFRAIGAAYRQPISAPHSNNRLARVTTCRLGILQLLLERNKDLLMPLERHTQIYTHTTAMSLHTFTLSLQFSRWTFSPLTRETRIPLPETRDTATDTPTESCFSYLLSPLLPSPTLFR